MTAILQKLISKWVWKTSKCIRKEITKDMHVRHIVLSIWALFFLCLINDVVYSSIPHLPSYINAHTKEGIARHILDNFHSISYNIFDYYGFHFIYPAFHQIDFFLKISHWIIASPPLQCYTHNVATKTMTLIIAKKRQN